MNHAITVGGLLFVVSILAGLAMVAGGVLASFAAMADPTGLNKNTGGCIALLLGLAFIVGGVWGLLS